MHRLPEEQERLAMMVTYDLLLVALMTTQQLASIEASMQNTQSQPQWRLKLRRMRRR